MQLELSRPGADLVEPSSKKIDFRWRDWTKPLLFLAGAMVVLGFCLYFRYVRHDLTSAGLADDVERLHGWHDSHPVALPLVVIAAFVISTGLSIPAVITLSVLSGWLLGLWEGFAVVSFSSTAGATVAFLISRYLLRDAIVDRWKMLIARADESVERDGAYYALSLRLVHVIPSWLVNLVLGCTKMPLRTFWWTTQLGMIPSTLLYVYFGSHLPSLAQIKEQGVSSIATPTVIGVFVLLAILPLAVRQVFRRPQTGTK